MQTPTNGELAGNTATPTNGENTSTWLVKKQTLGEIYAELFGEVDIKKNHELKKVLNQPPPKKWLKVHPVYQNTYLPIDKVELLLDLLFAKWEVEIIQTSIMANSVFCHIRLKVYQHDGEVRVVDGVGAAPLQVNKDANPTDISQLKSNAVMLAVPIAKTNTIKDAEDHLGEIFGRSANRKDVLSYTEVSKTFDELKTEILNAKI